ncbi:hypothetical protein MTO96_009727 [Rhipicephalus appendiculatus]
MKTDGTARTGALASTAIVHRCCATHTPAEWRKVAVGENVQKGKDQLGWRRLSLDGGGEGSRRAVILDQRMWRPTNDDTRERKGAAERSEVWERIRTKALVPLDGGRKCHSKTR